MGAVPQWCADAVSCSLTRLPGVADLEAEPKHELARLIAASATAATNGEVGDD